MQLLDDEYWRHHYNTQKGKGVAAGRSGKEEGRIKGDDRQVRVWGHRRPSKWQERSQKDWKLRRINLLGRPIRSRWISTHSSS